MPEQLKPDWPYLKESLIKTEQKHRFDKHHKAHPLSVIPDGINVWIIGSDDPIPEVVTAQAENPR